MATKTTRRVKRTPTVKKEEIIESSPIAFSEAPVTPSEVKKPMSCKKALGLSALGLLVLLAGFWYKTNTWPVAAVVNGSVISRFTLDKNLYQQGGKMVLDSLVTEKLVKRELDKQKVSVSKEEVDKRYKEITSQLPAGSDVKSLLAAQGMTEADLMKQLELQLRLQKYLGSKIVVSDAEVEKYITDNSSYLTGTTSAEKKNEAIEALKGQKTQAEYSSWLDSIKKAAKVWTPDNSWSASATQK